MNGDQNRRLQQRVSELEEIVKQLQQGKHDIELDGGSQQDMTTLFDQCNEDPTLESKIKTNDSTGTLQLFWQEQMQRITNPDATKRKHWNPIVLRFIMPVACDLY